MIDAALLDAERVHFHPLVNTASSRLRPAELLDFIRSCAREPMPVGFGAAEGDG